MEVFYEILFTMFQSMFVPSFVTICHSYQKLHGCGKFTPIMKYYNKKFIKTSYISSRLVMTPSKLFKYFHIFFKNDYFLKKNKNSRVMMIEFCFNFLKAKTLQINIFSCFCIKLCGQAKLCDGNRLWCQNSLFIDFNSM